FGVGGVGRCDHRQLAHGGLPSGRVIWAQRWMAASLAAMGVRDLAEIIMPTARGPSRSAKATAPSWSSGVRSQRLWHRAVSPGRDALSTSSTKTPYTTNSDTRRCAVKADSQSR